MISARDSLTTLGLARRYHRERPYDDIGPSEVIPERDCRTQDHVHLIGPAALAAAADLTAVPPLVGRLGLRDLGGEGTEEEASVTPGGEPLA